MEVTTKRYQRLLQVMALILCWVAGTRIWVRARPSAWLGYVIHLFPPRDEYRLQLRKYPSHLCPLAKNTLIRPGKLNSQFIVTAHMDFQISDCIQQVYGTLAPPPRAMQLKGVASAIASSNLAFLTLILVWNLNNDHPPACKIKESVTINWI